MSLSSRFLWILFCACLCSCGLDPSYKRVLEAEKQAELQAVKLIIDAEQALSSKRFAEAKLIVERADSLAPTNEKVQEMRWNINSIWALREPEMAATLNIQLSVDRTEALAVRGELLPVMRLSEAASMIRKKQFDKARSALTELKTLDDKSLSGQRAVLLFQEAQLEIQSNSPKSAMDGLRETIAAEDTFWQARLQLAQLLSQNGDHDEAIAQMELALAQQEDGITRFVEGVVLKNAGEAARSAEAFSRATRFSNAPRRVHSELGQVYFQQKNYALAQQHFGQAFAQNNQVSDRFNQGIALKGAKMFDKSAVILDQVVQLQPKIGRTHVELIDTLLAGKQMSAAQQALNRYLALKSTHKELEEVYPQVIELVKKSKSQPASEPKNTPTSPSSTTRVKP